MLWMRPTLPVLFIGILSRGTFWSRNAATPRSSISVWRKSIHGRHRPGMERTTLRSQRASEVRRARQGLKRDSEAGHIPVTGEGRATTRKSRPGWRTIARVGASLIRGLGMGLWLLHAQKVQALCAAATVVLADF